jgi:diketogulonate reductase-like aldo/keto reductase
MAYGSMGGLLMPEFIKHFFVQRAANDLQKTPQETLLAWGMQQKVTIIPGSTKKKHMDGILALEIDEKQKIFSFEMPVDERMKCYQPDAASVA